jgi:outer membrane protein assembly factor BamB
MLVVLLGLLGVVSVSSPAGAATMPSAWPQLGADAAHTGVNPNETILNASTASHLSPKWIFETYAGFPPSVPVVADGAVFTNGFYGSLESIDQATGALNWRDALGASPSRPFTAPVIANGTLYSYQVQSGLLYAINDATGIVERTTPMLDNDGLVYSDGVLYTEPDNLHGPTPPMGAYDAATGAQLWTANVGSLLAPPAVANGEVFADGDNGVVVLSASTGVQLWTADGAGQPNPTPVVSGNRLIVTGTRSYQRVYNTTTGRFVWGKVLAKGYDTWSAPAARNGTIFQSIEEGCTGDTGSGPETSILTARSLSTRHLVWSRKYENLPCSCGCSEGSAGPRSPTIANGLVYVPDMGGQAIRVYTTSGRPVGSVSTAHPPTTTAVVANGELFVATYDGSFGYVEAFGP